jgi:hypothetical protein
MAMLRYFIPKKSDVIWQSLIAEKAMAIWLCFIA